MRHPILRFIFLSATVSLGVFLSASLNAAPKALPNLNPTPTPAPKAATPPKSNYNTNVFEKEDDSLRFSDTVKLVRDMDGNTEVLFMKRGGIYQAPNDQTALAALIESQRNKTPVSVVVQEANQKIMSVIASPRATGGGQ